jgi:hypothetical protein
MMKTWAILSAAATFLVAGCASKTKQQPTPPPGMAGAAAAPFPAVMFTGDVKMPVVPWVEGMNLAQGLIAAQYSAYWDPRTITVTRNGIPYKVDVKKFLRGEENPELQSGDMVEVRR